MVGQFYKAQLGMGILESGQMFYSTAGIFKYTAYPKVVIADLLEKGISYGRTKYEGIYEMTEDSSEKVYEYCFDLYFGSELIETSGKLLHKSDEDTSSTKTSDYYGFKTELKDNQFYQIIYTVYTNNNLIVSSPVYYIRKPVEYRPIYQFNISAENIYDEGIVKIILKGESSHDIKYIVGNFCLCRANSLDNFMHWDEIDTFTYDTKLNAFTNDIEIYKDHTVEQGVEYKYAFYQFDDNGLTTEKSISNIVKADFEDTFLSDGERQLKIKFNPKVSSLKNTILEQKMDTIGGKYPFVFRNGNTNYKEIPISGLISLLMDDNNLFFNGFEDLQKEVRTETMAKATALKSPPRRHNLTSQNFTDERVFKLKVLEWLTDGKPKLFRSPAEGNYLIRLMNTSLSPNDTLGRMLHTFTSTGYEIAENTFNNLKKYGFIHKVDNRIETMHYQIINLDNYQNPTTVHVTKANSAIVRDATPGAVFDFTLEKGNQISITIGNTGMYIFPVDQNNMVVSIGFNPKNRGIIELGYVGKFKYNITDQVTWYEGEEENQQQVTKDMKLVNIECIEKCDQYIGTGKDFNIIDSINKTVTEYQSIQVSKLHNIIILRIQTIDDIDVPGEELGDPGDYHYTLQFENGQQIDFNLLLDQELNTPYSSIRARSRGYIEYALSENFNYFKPISITLGASLVADVFYSVITNTYESIDQEE